MSNNTKIRNLAHFTALISEISEEKEGKLFRIFKVFHPVLEAQTDIRVREVSSSYHILEKYMDLLVCGTKESRNPAIARIKDKDQLLSLLGINFEGYEIASLYFDDLVNEGHFKVTDRGIFPLKCAELSIDSVSLEELYKSLKEDSEPLPQQQESPEENVKLEYKYTDKLLFEKKLFDQYSLELMPREFYGLDGFLAVSPKEKAQKNGSNTGVWLPPGIKLLGGAAAIQRSLDNLSSAEFSFIEKGIPEGTESITLAPDCQPELIYCPYYLAVYKTDEGQLRFAVHEVLYGKEIKWLSDKYNNPKDLCDEYFNAKTLIASLCEKEENTTVYSPVFADWPLKIDGRTAYEYGYREGENGNFIWQLQPWQLESILKKCKNAEHRRWVEFALTQKLAVLDSYEAGRLVETVFPDELREQIEKALESEPETAQPDEAELNFIKLRSLYIEKPQKAVEKLSALADQNAEASFLLGRFYLENKEKPDLNLSIQYLKKARELKFAPAGYFLCLALSKRDGARAEEEIKTILTEDEPCGFAPTLYALSQILKESDPEKAEALRAKAEEMGFAGDDTLSLPLSVIAKSKASVIPKSQEETPKDAIAKEQEIKDSLSRIEAAADKKDAEEAAMTKTNTAEAPQIPYNEPHFSEEVDKTVSFGENLPLNADEIVKRTAENRPKKEFTDEEYHTISSRLWGMYASEELEYLARSPKKNLYSTTAFAPERRYPGLCSASCDKKPACFKSRSVAPTYSDFVEYSKVTSADFLKNLPHIDAEEFFARDPDPFSKIIPEYKNAPKISDRHDLSYRYATLSAYFEDSEFEELRKAIFEGFKNNTRYETLKNFRKKHVLDAPTQNKAIMLFWRSFTSYISSRSEEEVLKKFSETLTQNGEISQLIKNADLSLSQGKINAAEEILRKLTPFSGHAAFLTAQINRRRRDTEKYTENLLLARSLCSPYAFDITDNALCYGDFKEFSSVYRISKYIGKYAAENSDIRSDFDSLLYYDDEDYGTRSKNDTLAKSFLNVRKSFLWALESALKKELENTPFLPTLTRRNDRSGVEKAAALGGVVAAEKLADKFLRAKNYTAAENCLTFAASRGNISAAKSLVNFYLTAENWNPKKACYVLDRICDVDSDSMALYVLLFKLGLDTEITQYREIVQVTRDIISKF